MNLQQTNIKQAVDGNEFPDEYTDGGIQPPPLPPSHQDSKCKCLIFINYET